MAQEYCIMLCNVLSGAVTPYDAMDGTTVSTIWSSRSVGYNLVWYSKYYGCIFRWEVVGLSCFLCLASCVSDSENIPNTRTGTHLPVLRFKFLYIRCDCRLSSYFTYELVSCCNSVRSHSHCLSSCVRLRSHWCRSRTHSKSALLY